MGGGGEVVLPAYTGFIATRGYFPNRLHATNTQLMSQTRHIARETVASLKLVFANAYLTAGTVAETAAGSAATITASISKSPSGPWTSFTFTGTAADSSLIVSDPLAFALTRDEVFYVRRWSGWTGSGKCVYAESQGDAANGDTFRIGTSVVDVTAGGTPSGGSSANSFYGGPLAIIGQTTQPSVLLIGDSIGYGVTSGSNTTRNAQGDSGIVLRALGANLAYCNASRSNDAVQMFLASNTLRRQLGQWASHVVTDYGRNDLDVSRTAAQIKADLESIPALYGKPLWQTTITPKSSSSDSFATVGNQTVASTNAARNTLNTAIKAGLSGFAGAFDICPAIENDAAAGDGKWKALHTPDGTHPSETGYAAVESSGVIDYTRLRR